MINELTEFAVTLENRPGTLAELTEALGGARVNIAALHGMTFEDRGLIRFVADQVAEATEALESAGIAFETREVLAVDVLDQPGTLGDVARVMSDAGINVDSVYVTSRGTVVLGVDDVAGAQQVAGGMDVRPAE